MNINTVMETYIFQDTVFDSISGLWNLKFYCSLLLEEDR